MQIGGKMKLSLEGETCFTQKQEMAVRNKWLSSDVTIGFSSHQPFSQEHGQTSLQCHMEVHLSQPLLEMM